MSQLFNHLLAYRKRLSLSQDEVAFLLGALSGAKVCRYERFLREPSLQTVIAYEVIFQCSSRELFAGLYQKIEGEVALRAKALLQKAHGAKPSRSTSHKLQTLANIADLRAKKPSNRS